MNEKVQLGLKLAREQIKGEQDEKELSKFIDSLTTMWERRSGELVVIGSLLHGFQWRTKESALEFLRSERNKTITAMSIKGQLKSC